MKLKPNHPLAQNLKCSLLFNEGGGNILYDATGHMNNGEGTNIVWGREGLDLPGSDEHIKIPNIFALADNWTIFLTFIQDVRNPHAQTHDTQLVSMEDPDGRTLLYILDRSTHTLASYVGGAQETANTVIETGTPYSVALSKQGTQFNFYLNGVDDGSYVATAGAGDGDLILFDRKGATGDGCFDGTVGVFHCFNRGLSADEARWLDADPIGMYEPDFIASMMGIESGDVTPINTGALMMMLMARR